MQYNIETSLYSDKVPQPLTRKCYATQPLTIRINLSEKKMNKANQAISQKAESSPIKSGSRATSTSPSFKGSTAQSNADGTNITYEAGHSQRFSNHTPEYSELVPMNADNMATVNSLAKRRNQLPPLAINTTTQLPEGRFCCFSEELGSDPENLLNGLPHEKSRFESKNTPHAGLDNQKGFKEPEYMIDLNLEQQLKKAAIGIDGQTIKLQRPDIRSKYPKRQQSLVQNKQSKGIIESMEVSSAPLPALATTMAGVSRAETLQSSNGCIEPNLPFSPLPLYFRGRSFPSARKGEKTTIGQNGWLECTSNVFENHKKPPVKKSGFLKSIKKMAKDMTTDLNSSYKRPNLSPQEPTTASQGAISLDPREQSLLYCELEFHLTSAMNDYITAEFDKGHLLPENLKKVSDLWIQRGRPRVVSFRYDLETQLELVALHLHEFDFHGRRQRNEAEIMDLLHSMKLNARAMRVRSFCHPDSVISTQLINSQSLFNMLNISNAQQLALAEIGHFFRMIMERERSTHESQEMQAKSIALNRPGSMDWDSVRNERGGKDLFSKRGGCAPRSTF